MSGKNKLKHLSLQVLLMFSRWVRLAKMHFYDQFLSGASTASGDRQAIMPALHNFFGFTLINLD
jgi:hypothetical protein